MAQLRPVPAPRKKSTETVGASPSLPPLPTQRKLRDNTADKPVPPPRTNVNKRVVFNEDTEELEESKYEQIVEASNNLYSTLDYDLTPPLPPRPKVTSERFSAELYEILKTNFHAFKNNDANLKGILKNRHSDSVVNHSNQTMKNTNNEVIKRKLVASVLPTVQESKMRNSGNLDFELNRFLKKLLDSEMQYIKKLDKALEISREFQLAGSPESTVLKFFGKLKEIHTFHKNIFYKDLEENIDKPKKMISCFAKHASRFSVYIERHWLVPQETDLTDFELFLLNERNLKEYIHMSKERVMEYIKTLAHLKYYFQFNSFDDCNDYLSLTNDAIGVVENICYQLEVTKKLQSIENIRNKFKECGQVYLNNTFRISIDGSKRSKYHVYFCENLIVFVSMQENGSCQYFDDISVSACYYCIVKNKPLVFELGIKNKKRYILKADTQVVRDRWCEKLSQVFRSQVSKV
ncbi:hypothetical protein ILUMI_26510 [Ignelater luminosus]|uniref:DH domain-containing protein n=1 Tax=Ignelater luminosus TaxID=2038154 RepID=A0A8K0C7U4_IGNLU|nr:hypothetical protein ILUMI_26510 [Ignelater luminosus]